MLFMSSFTFPFIKTISPPQVNYSPALGFNSNTSTSIRWRRVGTWTARRGKNDEIWGVHTPVELNRTKQFQASIMESCGTAVIKTWMRRRGRGLHSISYRSHSLSLLTDWLLGTAALLCKVHYIITLQKIILSTNTKSYTLHTPTGDTWTLELFWAQKKKKKKKKTQ